jgi:phosphoglycerate kinase
MSHLGDPDKERPKPKRRPKRKENPLTSSAYLDGKHRMKPVAEYLSKLLGRKLPFCLHVSGRKRR